MKNHRFVRWAVLFVGFFVLVFYPLRQSVSASAQIHTGMHRLSYPQAAPTPIPAQGSSVSETPEARVMPPVGSNAGLVLGAAVLVLIIISGVIISSRWKAKH